jgi:hypothetical protein
MTAAHHDEKETTKLLAARDIVEKLDGKEAKVTVVEVTMAPGQAGTPYRHPGPAFGYVRGGCQNDSRTGPEPFGGRRRVGLALGCAEKHCQGHLAICVWQAAWGHKHLPI